MIDNRRVKINHPLADTLSISTGKGAYAGMYTSEIAFFLKKEWVVNPIHPFVGWHDGSPNDSSTAVYPYVDNDVLEQFIAKYRCE
jgi:hypothetical protein